MLCFSNYGSQQGFGLRPSSLVRIKNGQVPQYHTIIYFKDYVGLLYLLQKLCGFAQVAHTLQDRRELEFRLTSQNMVFSKNTASRLSLLPEVGFRESEHSIRLVYVHNGA